MFDDKVTAGQVIGKVGSAADVKQFPGTGKFAGPHLHLEVIHGQASITLREIAVSAGSVALAPHERPGWLTYNFEVERLDTYIAGGARAHYDSTSVCGSLGAIPVDRTAAVTYYAEREVEQPSGGQSQRVRPLAGR
jgi:murein DD-endopeptidase MepM/ murein hydrolase activator NlpD